VPVILFIFHIDKVKHKHKTTSFFILGKFWHLLTGTSPVIHCLKPHAFAEAACLQAADKNQSGYVIALLPALFI